MSVGQCLQKGATTKPDQFKAWLEKQEQERGLVPGSILEGREAAFKSKTLARRGDWEWAYCQCKSPGTSCAECLACAA